MHYHASSVLFYDQLLKYEMLNKLSRPYFNFYKLTSKISF